MIPENCSFVFKGNRCPLPPEFIIEINDETKQNKFMIGLACSDHRIVLEQRFLQMQQNNAIPRGKITLSNVKVIHTDCVKGNVEDEEEVKLKRLDGSTAL
ncbi:MAG: hypothetical protein AB7V56_05390 [Candidatus Nitrosocosmicus sp.]|uniref:hypothetical protein n=1 Tax=Candidatus Nitrosocosmicus agrestis TaxID=2563600 RepID=UPI00122DF6D0|nr:hypothetical protein [Candidatus Nitrosocosmicus sp. SS]MDR4490975.1 hypothetical protein [Candidatus Nitrosocosmicus sp.]HET8792514.1 hypothetical protein [Nitrososphaeraceae archaeon]KAA2282773.1 hypothetical protein F1Z66_05650 [Candidatus Nitrosocosmicus sp. SS]KAF0870293.1 hypothetical protein E5N71_00120 [Candidatus Nitrosocosmicus sp. SS]HET6589153.1 hypothetical protein [Candidatus Nitrosocosmicus sp.]